MNRNSLSIALSGALLITAAANGQPSGNANSISSGAWSAGTTWDTGATPTGVQDAQIENGHEVTIGPGDTVEAFRVLLGESVNGDTGTLTMSGGSLNTDRVFSVGGFEQGPGINGVGVFNQTGGDVNIGAVGPGGIENFVLGDIGSSQAFYNVSGGSLVANGSITLALGALTEATVVQSGGDLSAGEINIAERGTATYTMTGGSLTATASSGSGRIFIGRVGIGDDIGQGQLNQSGGTVRAEGDFWVGNVGDPNAVYTLSGTAAVNVGGNLAVVPSAGANGVAAGEPFGPTGASGTMNLIGPDVTVNVTGNLLADGAGSTAGDPTNQSLFNYTPDAAGGVSTIVANSASIEGALFDVLETTPVAPGTVLDLVTTAQGISGFAGAGLGPNATGLYQLQLGGDMNLTLQAVRLIPEPTALALLVTPLGYLVRRRR